MKKDRFQRIMFIIFAVCAFLSQILSVLPWFKYTMLAASIFYILLGWYFDMIRNGGDPMGSVLAGCIYSIVFIANFMETSGMPTGVIVLYASILLSFGLMIYMIIRHKTVKRDMLIQSILLFMLSPGPIFN
ncbi:MAG: hypothetical protein WAV93_02670 [Bacteroidales bacterium]